MRIFRRYHEYATYEFKQSKRELSEKLIKGKSKQSNVYEFFIEDQIEILKVKVLSESKFETSIEPSMFDPFKGTGKIQISILNKENSSSVEVLTEIIPYNEGYIVTVYLLFIFLVICTIVGIIVSTNFYTLIIIVFGWTVFPLILYMMPFQNRKKLRVYREGIIKKLKMESSR